MTPDRRSIGYIPEIDGLRAIAVLSVVLFHADAGPAAGFVGVDIFFVISGYLITSLLFREWQQTGHISFIAFYARRFRRLFAALVFVISITVMLAAALLPPHDEIIHLTESAAASLLFFSNFYFQFTTGDYFDGNAELLPLLHIWSLSVEEQYYLVWPAILVILLRLRPGMVIPSVIILCLCSLVLSEFLVRNYPNAAFYQMPSRFWELAIGGVIALAPQQKQLDGRLFSYAGLIILLPSLFIPAPYFPGLGALGAVAGSACLIYSVHGTNKPGLPGRVLASKPMRSIGLISYSLYLWHWPLLALARSMHVGPTPVWLNISLCILAVALSVFTYRYIEQPFRRSGTENSRIVSAGLAASFALALAVNATGDVIYKHPLPSDLASLTGRDMPDNRHECHHRGNEALHALPRPACSSRTDTTPAVAIWGDSMALAWQPFTVVLGDQTNMAYTSYTRDACPPAIAYLNGKNPAEEKLCMQFNKRALDAADGLDTLIISAAWQSYFNRERHSATGFSDRLSETISLASRTVKNILIIGPTPVLPDTAPRCINSADITRCNVEKLSFLEKTSSYRSALQNLADNYSNVTYIDPVDFFCVEDYCEVLKDGYGLYWDANHVSSTAARNFALQYLQRSTE